MLKKALVTMLMLILILLAVAPGFSSSVIMAASSLADIVESDRQLPNPPGNISETQALEIIKNTFPELTRDKTLIPNRELSYDAGNRYHFVWNDDTYMRPDRKTARITASVDAQSGRVTSFFYRPDLELYRGKTAVYSREEALAAAEEFLRKNHSELIGSLEYQPDAAFYPEHRLENTHNFYWSRLKNGIPVNIDGITIHIDAVLGIITQYNFDWHTSSFPEPQDLISVDELSGRLLAELGVYPSYLSVPDAYNDSSVKSVFPVYMINSNAYVFDAQSGQALNWNGTVIDNNQLPAYNYSFQPGPGVTDFEDRTEEKPDYEQLKKMAEELYELIGVKGQINREEYNGQGLWEFSMEKTNGRDSGTNYNLAINENTAEIQEYNSYSWGLDRPSQAGDPASFINYQQAVSVCRAFLQKVNPEKLSQVVLAIDPQAEMPNNTYNIRFNRLVNDIVYKNNGIDLEIDKTSSEILRYRLEWSETFFAPAQDIISPQQAVNTIRQEEPLELIYVLTDSEYGNTQAGPAILGYRFTDPMRINARTGSLIGHWGTEQTDDERLKACRSHWILPAMELLNRTGLIPETGIDPDGIINRREAIKIITRAFDMNRFLNDGQSPDLVFTDLTSDDPDRGAILRAVKSGMIKNEGRLNPNISLSREELAEWLVNCLNYQEIALIENNFALNAVDAEEVKRDKRNFTAIANGLGLLNTDQHGRFNPQRACTWAEVIAAAVKIIPYM